MSRPVFLIGFMCSGKTTLGVALARAFGLKFIDLDQYVEAKAGMSVSEIFKAKGEAAFRQLEAKALDDACQTHDTIVACGGGTPCSPGAMDKMNAHGTTVYLRPSADRLVRRLFDGRSSRPLIASITDADEMKAFLRDKLQAREPWYGQAMHTFDSSLLETDEEIAKSVENFKKLIYG